MPELAEVEHSRRQWDLGIGQPILEVQVARPEVRVFRETDVQALRRGLTGQRLLDSEARGKQMLFHFSGDCWLGIHLGMSGELRREQGPETSPHKHDHLLLRLRDRALIFEDKRHFGRVRFHHGANAPDWWTALPAGVLSEEFTNEATARFLLRRKRTPIKGVLLMQEHFLGVGNWMADEILWRSGIHPSTAAGDLDDGRVRQLWEQTVWVSKTAIRIINDDWTYPPDWLFAHRWEAGGHCPRCNTSLERATIGGRTTCWCPRCQPGTTSTASADSTVRRRTTGKKGVPKSPTAVAAKQVGKIPKSNKPKKRELISS